MRKASYPHSSCVATTTTSTTTTTTTATTTANTATTTTTPTTTATTIIIHSSVDVIIVIIIGGIVEKWYISDVVRDDIGVVCVTVGCVGAALRPREQITARHVCNTVVK